MNWKTLGDGTSLFVYDILLHVCKESSLPLWFIPMWTMPEDKYIIVPKTDTYRVGRRNDELVNLMRKFLYNETQKDFISREKKRLVDIRIRRNKLGGAEIYRSNYIEQQIADIIPEKKSSKSLLLSKLEEFSWQKARETIAIANFYRQKDVDIKMLFKKGYRGRNTFSIKNLQSFTNQYRNEYIDKLQAHFYKNSAPCIVFLDPNIGIEETGLKISSKLLNSYILLSDLKKILDVLNTDSIIAVRNTKKNHSPKYDNAPRISELLNTFSNSAYDTWSSAEIIFLSKKKETESHLTSVLRTYQSQYKSLVTFHTT